mgnify:CR=1 FL=1
MARDHSIKHRKAGMEIVLDVENTTIKRNGKLILDPFEPSNFLVQVGMMSVKGSSECIVTLDHVEQKDTSGAGRKEIQKVLDMTTLLIMHNAQHDLMWLWECGFKYSGDIYDTMLAEYLLLRGQKQPLPTLKKDTTQMKYPSKNLVITSVLTLVLLGACTSSKKIVMQIPPAKPCIKSEPLPLVPVKPSPDCICQESGWISTPYSK